jgi:hypothetical protein
MATSLRSSRWRTGDASTLFCKNRSPVLCFSPWQILGRAPPAPLKKVSNRVEYNLGVIKHEEKEIFYLNRL